VSDDVTIRRARPDDLDAIVPLVAGFYVVDRHPFHEARVRAALGPLLAGDEFGTVLAMCRPHPIGYAVLCWSYSIESGGREACLDEIFVRDRGNGLGGRLLTAALDTARSAGVRIVFLETEAHNQRVRGFYARHGFTEEGSVWMRQEL
jgi:GNAT superfamily N-acetyltransferase